MEKLIILIWISLMLAILSSIGFIFAISQEKREGNLENIVLSVLLGGLSAVLIVLIVQFAQAILL